VESKEKDGIWGSLSRCCTENMQYDGGASIEKNRGIGCRERRMMCGDEKW
jgi:hypothetical protein